MFKFKKKEKEPLITGRIKAIYDKLKIMYEGEHPDVFYFMDVNSCGGLYYYGYTVKTKNGTRKILVNSDYSIFYGDKNLWTKKNYIPLPGESSYSISGIFAISTYPKIDIILNPGFDLTPEEMDSDIIEFERAIEPEYSKSFGKAKLKAENKKINEKLHQARIDYFSKT